MFSTIIVDGRSASMQFSLTADSACWRFIPYPPSLNNQYLLSPPPRPQPFVKDNDALPNANPLRIFGRYLLVFAGYGVRRPRRSAYSAIGIVVVVGGSTKEAIEYYWDFSSGNSSNEHIIASSFNNNIVFSSLTCDCDTSPPYCYCHTLNVYYHVTNDKQQDGSGIGSLLLRQSRWLHTSHWRLAHTMERRTCYQSSQWNQIGSKRLSGEYRRQSLH